MHCNDRLILLYLEAFLEEVPSLFPDTQDIRATSLSEKKNYLILTLQDTTGGCSYRCLSPVLGTLQLSYHAGFEKRSPTRH